MDTISMLVRVGLCSGPALALAGCMNSTSIYDKHLGEAIHIVHIMQALNPNASMNSNPVSGVDEHAATSAMDRCNTQYRMPQSDASAFTVGVSSGNSLDSMNK